MIRYVPGCKFITVHLASIFDETSHFKLCPSRVNSVVGKKLPPKTKKVLFPSKMLIALPLAKVGSPVYCIFTVVFICGSSLFGMTLS